MNKKSIAIFGSAFNPPTLGHADAISQVCEHFDEVWLIPSRAHATKTTMLDIDSRMAMILLFIDDLRSAKINNLKLHDAESGINEKPIYTYKLLEHLSNKYKDCDFTFLCGEDNFKNFSSFKKSSYIESNWEIKELLERNDIRSTLVRANCKANTSIEKLVTKSVERYISHHGLYIS
ncbi:adenylyltransferase/cytidyltransferase family protein [Photobacterium kishitanii]|uniref:adenylyltransferase/cytidyltransferase family protein n=1 Tax=Photobacterium kishitanii TaxID=318456 RepID=UPI0015E79864|nr:adenylyltransferase/cytidyltransferase family protein [Photobacterium kishitanii]